MKVKSLFLVLVTGALVAGLGSFKPKPRLVHRDPAPLIFWTSNRSYGPIEIFVDNVYKGEITSSYSSRPDCASPGCVTVLIRGTEWFRAQTKDGKHKWQSWQHTALTANACNSEELQ